MAIPIACRPKFHFVSLPLLMQMQTPPDTIGAERGKRCCEMRAWTRALICFF